MRDSCDVIVCSQKFFNSCTLLFFTLSLYIFIIIINSSKSITSITSIG